MDGGAEGVGGELGEVAGGGAGVGGGGGVVEWGGDGGAGVGWGAVVCGGEWRDGGEEKGRGGEGVCAGAEEGAVAGCAGGE